jgi:hypothetical protein
MMRRLALPISWLGVAVAFSAAANGGTVNFSRTTVLEASGAGSELRFNLSDGTTTLEPFDKEIGDDISNEGGTTRATARQTSGFNVDSGEGAADASTFAQVAEFGGHAAKGTSSFLLTFDVIGRAETMRLTGEVEATFDAFASVAVTDASQATSLFDATVAFGLGATFPFEQTLTLQPGRYRLVAAAISNGTPSFNTSRFEVAFSIGAGDGGTAIPLPPAARAGLSGLALAALAVRNSRCGRVTSPAV